MWWSLRRIRERGGLTGRGRGLGRADHGSGDKKQGEENGEAQKAHPTYLC